MGKRILANFIDYIILCFLTSLLGMLLLPFGMETAFKLFDIIMIIPLILFLFKDIVKGQSIGKRILKVKVVNEEGNLPSAFKLFIRNITIFIWPIEVILMLLQKKRLGERITGTRIADI